MADKHSGRNLVTAGLLGAAVGGFAWQVHGFWWGLAVLIAYNILIIPVNWLVMWLWARKERENGLGGLVSWFQTAKWVLFVVFTIGIMISGAELVRD